MSETNRPISPAAITVGVLLLLLGAGAVLWSILSPGANTLVVYCSHDLVYAEPIIREFEKRTGIEVVLVADTEASKSLGLVQKILAEKDRPTCDVFWNNEQLGMMDLAKADALEIYKGTGWERMPDRSKHPAGLWTGFAARMRVWIVNTDHAEATQPGLKKVLEEQMSRVGIAKPIYGTTRTHYTVLWHLWGEEKTKAWHMEWREGGIIELPGNGPVARQVGSGTLYLGLTDTDDAFDQIDQKKPVAIMPVELENGHAVIIPNTVAIIKGTRKKDAARKLVDFLLSAEVELMLADSKARQIPLGPVDEAKLNEDVKKLLPWAAKAYPLGALDEASAECLAWLREEYVK
ncbi:MAG: extracellular solute-binding protein [Phycisphaeraceae bacterium]